MPENEIFALILNKYIADNKVSEKEKNSLKKFCGYAEEWLTNSGIVGVGHASNGLTLRFTDGQELMLFKNAEAALQDMPAVSVTGNASGGVRGAGAMVDSSIRVTG